MSSTSKYADSPHPRVLKSRVLSKFESPVDAQQQQQQQPGSSASLIVPVVILSSSRRVTSPDEASNLPTVSLGGGDGLLGESTTDGEPTSPVAPGSSATESTGGNAVDSVESFSEGDPLSPLLAPALSGDAAANGLLADAPVQPPERTTNGTPQAAELNAASIAAGPAPPARNLESTGSHGSMLTPIPPPATTAPEVLLSQAVAFSDLLFEAHSGSLRSSLVAPLPMPALSPLPLELSTSSQPSVDGEAGSTPLSSMSATAVPSPAVRADHEAPLRQKNPARKKSSPLSRTQPSSEMLSVSQAPSDISSTDQPVSDMLARLAAMADAAGNDVLRKAIAAAGPLQLDEIPTAGAPEPFVASPQAQWDVAVMESDGEVRLERRDSHAVVAQVPPSLRALLEPGDMVVNTPENFPDRFCVHPGNTLRLSAIPGSVESLLLRFSQANDAETETPPPTPPGSRAVNDAEIYVLFFPALGHDDSDSLPPVSYAYCKQRALLESSRGKNIEALRAAFLTLQDHLAAHLTFDSPLVTLFELEGRQYHAVHRPVALTAAVLLVVPVELSSGATVLAWMDNLLALFLTLHGTAQAFGEELLQPRLDALFDLYFNATLRRDAAMDSWDTLTHADLSASQLMEVRETLCRLEGLSVSAPLNRRGACIAHGSCVIFGGLLLHSQLPAVLLRHTVAILRAFGLLQAAERVSVTLWLPLHGLDDNGRPVFLAVRASEQAVLCSVLSGWNVTPQFACDSFFLELLEESLALLARSEAFRRLGASLRAEPSQHMSPAPIVAARPRRTLASRLSRRRPQSPHPGSPARTPEPATLTTPDAVLFFMACDPGAGVIVLPKLCEQDTISAQAFRGACASVRKVLRGAQKRASPRAVFVHDFPLGQVGEYGILLPAATGATPHWVVGRLYQCEAAFVELYACFRDGTATHVVELAFRHLFGAHF